MFYRADTFVYTLFYFTANFLALFVTSPGITRFVVLQCMSGWMWSFSVARENVRYIKKGMKNVHEDFLYLFFSLKLNFNMIEKKNFRRFSPLLGIPFRSDYVFGYLLTLRCECFSVQMGINDKKVLDVSNIFVENCFERGFILGREICAEAERNF